MELVVVEEEGADELMGWDGKVGEENGVGAPFKVMS